MALGAALGQGRCNGTQSLGEGQAGGGPHRMGEGQERLWA